MSVPDNVVNKKLYASIKTQMQKEHKAKGKRWGAYSSGQLVQTYKRKGGKYSGKKGSSKLAGLKKQSKNVSRNSSRKSSKNENKLGRWYKEKWIDVCEYNKGKIRSCGRKSVDSGQFPYCRPLHRVNKGTPKTVKELSESQRKSLCKKKRINPKRTIRHSYSFSKKRKGHIKLISVKPSPNKVKKYRATFDVDGKISHTDFGAKGMSDFTKHKDKERRGRYITRHTKDLRTNDPTRAGYLSMYVLWNKEGLRESITDYKKRLNIYNSTGKFPTKIK
jgi:hypothetical protein